MNKKDQKFLLFAVTLLFCTGLGLIVLDNFFSIETPYGERENPLIDEVKLLHYIGGYFLLYLIGTIYKGHIKPKLNSKDPSKKKSGLTLITSVALLVLTGCGLLYMVDELVAEILEYIHIITGIIFSLFFFIHLYLKKRA